MSEPRNATIVDGNGLELWSAERLGQECGRGKRWVYRMHAGEGLPGVRLGGRLFFRPADYQAWLGSRLEVVGGGEA